MKRFTLLFCLVALFSLGMTELSQATLTNVALGGTATQSALGWSSSGAELAIDGNTEGNWYTHHLAIALAGSDRQTWWQVDLRNTYHLDHIVIWNRTDFQPSNLTNFYVQVKDASGNQVWRGDYFTDSKGYPNPSLTIALPADIFGEFVKIGYNPPGSRSYFQLAEVQVFASNTVPLPATLLFLGPGLLGLAAIRRRFKK